MDQQLSTLLTQCNYLLAANQEFLDVAATIGDEMERRQIRKFSQADAALLLIRNNRVLEARRILEPLVQQVPTDDDTVMALYECYQELNELDTGYAILEAACEKQGQASPSEKLLTELFFAQVRKQDYQKQFHTATSLYKQYKGHKASMYCGWAVSSLLLKYESLGDPSGVGFDADRANLSLTLAEKMLDRVMSQQKTLEKRLLGLYLEALSKQSKYSTMLDVMKKHEYPWPTWQNNHFHEFYVIALQNLNMSKELMKYLKSAFMKNKDDYELLKQIVDVGGMGKGSLKLVQTFLDELRAKHPSRLVALADLLYATKYMKEAGSTIRTKEALKMAYKYGSNKPSFYSDICEYLDNVKGTKTTVSELLKAWNIHRRKKNEVADYSYASIDDIIRDVNYELVHRHLVPDDDPIEKLERAHRCLEKYLRCEEQPKVPCIIIGKKGQGGAAEFSLKDIRDKESNYHDRLLTIAASTLLENCDKATYYLSIWGIQHKIRDEVPAWVLTSPFGPALANNNSTSERKTEESRRPYNYRLHDVEYLLMTSILLMEFGLEKSPHNFEFRILLCKAYTQIGAVQRAYEVIEGLNLKSIQWDTLGYLIMWRALNGGMYNEAATMMDTAKNIYVKFREDTTHAVFDAYQSGSFDRLPEFLKFRDMLCNAVQFGLVLCEEKLLEFMVACSPTEVREIAENLNREFATEPMYSKKEGLGDNRDFTVLQHLANDDKLRELKFATYRTDVNLFEIRSEILAIVTNMVASVSDSDMSDPDPDRISRKMDSIRSSVARLQECVSAYPTLLENNRETINFSGLWPPSNVQYQEINGVDSLMKQVALVVDLALDLKQPSVVLTQLNESIKKHFKYSMEWLNQRVSVMNLLNVAQLIEGTHVALETLSISRIVVDVALSLAKIKYQQVEKPDREPGTDNESELRKMCTTGLEALQTAVVEMFQFIDGFKITLQELGAFRWNEVSRHWDRLLGGNFLQVVFPQCFNNVQDYIARSYQHQMDGMLHVAANLVEYVEELDSSLLAEPKTLS